MLERNSNIKEQTEREMIYKNHLESQVVLVVNTTAPVTTSGFDVAVDSRLYRCLKSSCLPDSRC